MGVIVLAVMLIAGIVAIMNSIPLSIRTIYGYSKEFMGVTPRGDASQTPAIREIIESESPVPLARIVVLRGSDLQVRSIVGKWPFVVTAMSQDDAAFYLARMNAGKLTGRQPAPGAAEILLSEPVARNLGKSIGDQVLGPNDQDAFSPQIVKLVGVVESDQWFAIAPIDYYRENHFPPIDVLLVFAADRSRQAELDSWAVDRFRGQNVRVLSYAQVEEDTDAMFDILYRILNVVIGTLVIVITLMMGMLINIFLSQRIQEFGLLQALGYTKQRIVRRVLGESLIVVVGGWVLGVFCAIGLLAVVRAILMQPNAFALDILDSTAFFYTIPVPIAILTVAVLTVRHRFRRFDPIGIVERRTT